MKGAPSVGLQPDTHRITCLLGPSVVERAGRGKAKPATLDPLRGSGDYPRSWPLVEAGPESEAVLARVGGFARVAA